MIVYEVTCLVDGRRYIGSTKHLAVRWGQHCHDAESGAYGLPLHKAMREHGPDRFAIRAIACARTVPDLRVLERTLITQEGTGWPEGFNADFESLGLGKGAWEKRAQIMDFAERYGPAEAKRAMEFVRSASNAQVRRWREGARLVLTKQVIPPDPSVTRPGDDPIAADTNNDGGDGE